MTMMYMTSLSLLFHATLNTGSMTIPVPLNFMCNRTWDEKSGMFGYKVNWAVPSDMEVQRAIGFFNMTLDLVSPDGEIEQINNTEFFFSVRIDNLMNIKCGIIMCICRASFNVQLWLAGVSMPTQTNQNDTQYHYSQDVLHDNRANYLYQITVRVLQTSS